MMIATSIRRAGTTLAILATLIGATATTLAVGGCLDIPGSEEGEPCNSQGICATGLVCDEGTCKSEQNASSSWELLRTPFDSALQAIWGRGETDVLAVGDSGRILRYQGETEWREVKHGQQVSGTLHAVWSRGEDVWVGGVGVILHSPDGQSWSEQVVYDTSASSELTSGFTIHSFGGSADALYAVGRDGSYGGLVLRYDGSRWNTVPEASLSFVGRSVWVEGRKVYIVGEAKHVKHFDGADWLEQSLPTSEALTSIYNHGGTLIAAGPPSVLYRLEPAAAGAWEKVDQARAGYAASGVWGSGDDLFVVGAGGGYPYQQQFSSIERCNASLQCTSNIVPEEAHNHQLNAIWGTKSVLYAVGDSGIILRRR